MRSLILILGLPLFGACSSSGGHMVGDDESYNCAAEDRDDEFVVGLQKTGQKYEFRLMSATPAPPSRGDNEWLLQLDAIGGGAVTGAEILVTPFMPDHQHGTPLPTEVEVTATPGQYNLKPVNMWMPGLWETTIDVLVGDDIDQVVYRFCIPS